MGLVFFEGDLRRGFDGLAGFCSTVVGCACGCGGEQRCTWDGMSGRAHGESIWCVFVGDVVVCWVCLC